MNGQAWLGSRKESKGNEEPSLDGVSPVSRFVEINTDSDNSRRAQPPPPVDAPWQKGV